MSTDESYENKYLAQVRRLALEAFAGGRVFLFGSRARGPYRRSSDYDIAVAGFGNPEFSSRRGRFLELLDESLVPHEADVVNFDELDGDFRKRIEREKVEWTKD
jgi:predicted nucleotidyltransferase